MNEVEDDNDAKSMSFINESAEFVRGAKAAGGSEKVSHMIAERTIIGVLCDSHQLDSVIAQSSDSWENVKAEFFVSSYAITFGSEARVSFVDEGARGFRWNGVFPLISLRRMPNSSREFMVLRIL